eukprot:SM000077S21601  [mRNA]  locus=s77:475926:479551:- [translate_table: standard]
MEPTEAGAPNKFITRTLAFYPPLTLNWPPAPLSTCSPQLSSPRRRRRRRRHSQDGAGCQCRCPGQLCRKLILATTSQEFLGAKLRCCESSSQLPPAYKAKLTCQAELGDDVSGLATMTTRRQGLFALAATSAEAFTYAPDASAAYGSAANIFGKKTEQTGYRPQTGEGYQLQIPLKWNPSQEKDFGAVARWEDNFDHGSEVVVLKQPSGGKSSITDYGSPEQFMDKMSYILGEQTWVRENASEGGFNRNRVAAANLLDASQTKDNTDGTEGGRHQLISAAVKGGQLYVCKVSIGDKRWFKGTEIYARNIHDSFQVACGHGLSM